MHVCSILAICTIAEPTAIRDSCRRTGLGWLLSRMTCSGSSTKLVLSQISLGDPISHFPQWQDILVHHGGYWKKLIRKGISHAWLQRKNEYHAIELHARLGAPLFDEGWVKSLPTHQSSANANHQCKIYGCMQCRKSFASRAGEGFTCVEHITILLVNAFYLTARIARIV